MNSQHIVDALDDLIARYTQARNILATLRTPILPALVSKLEAVQAAPAADPQMQTQPAESPVVPTFTRLQPRKQRERRVHVRVREHAPRALAGSVPSTPVVVSAAQVARSRDEASSETRANMPAASSGSTAHPLDTLISQAWQRSREESLQ